MEATSGKKKYEKPELKRWGTIADLTGAGSTHAGGDFKLGSNSAQGPPVKRNG